MRRGWTIVTLTLAVACGGAGEDAETSVDGRQPQPDRPLLAASDVTLRERLTIEDETRAEQPRDVAVDGAGNIFVLDFSGATPILKYDSDGRYELRLGERDTDQDRVASAIEIDVSPWNTLFVLDRGKNSVLTYLTLGTFAASAEVQPGIGLDVHALPEFREYYLHRWNQSQRRAVVQRMREPADTLSTIYEVRIPPRATVREEARGVHFHTATDRLGNLYVGFYDGYPVRVLSPVGETVRIVDLDREPVRKSDAEIERETATNVERLQAELPGIDEELLAEAARPDSLRPVIEELVVDPLGRLWVRTNRARSSGTPYDVFNESGELLARVDVPGLVSRTTFGPDGALYVVARADSTAAALVTAYDVRFGEPAPAEP